MNGPVTGEKPVWERPWSLEEIRKSSHNWSLGADAGLLNFLKEFSQQTISRTHEIEKQLDGLVREVKTTDCRLHNVFNDFLMLSNTQFIENRVYDEEVEEHIIKPEQGEKPEQEKTREQKEAELIPKIQEAVNYGLQVLETAFEQLDIKAGNSDSEDEEVNERVEPILEPKDLYIDRPLPYLIGSQLFMQQEDVGLGDVSSEEGSVDLDRGSVLDSEEEEEEEEEDEDDDEEEKDNEEESEDDFGNNSEEEKKLRTALSDEDEDNGSDLFGESDKEDDQENDIASKSRPKSFADELAARIQSEIPKRLEADETSISSSSSEVKAKKEKEKKEVKKLPSDDEDDYLFKPPKLTDEDFFGNKGGLFSGGKGLFDDDDDEEGDLFSDLHPRESKPSEPVPVARPETLPSDVKKKPPYGGVSLFPGGENVINPSILADKDKRKPATPTDVAPKPVTSISLFDDDDVIFGGSAPAQPAAKAKPAADLFADDDDLFNDHPSIPPATISKTEVAADLDKKNIQIPSEKPQPTVPTIKKHAKGLFSDEEDSESDLFSPSQPASKPKATTPAAASKTSKALSLFDDDEDFFGTISESKPIPAATKPSPQPALPSASKAEKPALFNKEEKPEKISSDIKPVEKKTDSSVPPKSVKEEKVEKKSSLFDGDDDLFAITKDSQKKHHRVSLLFEEDENSEEPLFSSAGSATKSAGNTLEQSKMTAPIKVDTEKVSLFDDIDKKSQSKPPIPSKEDAVPPAVQKDNTVKSVPVKALDDLFADTPPTSKHVKTKSTNVLSLFGDEDDEDIKDQLSTSVSSKDSAENVSVEKNVQVRSTRVFQDEELLFSHELQSDNDPDVDLFASTSKKATEKPSTVKPPDGIGLFGDDDEDDLFSPVKPPKEKKTVIKNDSLDPPKEPSGLNVRKKEAILKPEVGEKPTEPPPVKSKSPSSRIGKLQANLHINPAALLPGAVPKLSGVRHVVPEAEISGVPVAESSQSSEALRKSVEAVSFETPAQVDTLHSANKSRAKVGGKRRPPTRMGRKLASQDSGEARDLSDSSPISPTQVTSSEAALAQSSWQPDTEEAFPSLKMSFSENDVHSRTKPKAPVNPLTPDVNDLFGSDLFGTSSLPDPVTSRQKEKLPVNEAFSQPKQESNKSSVSVFDADGTGSDDDLFKSIKEKHKKSFKPTSLLDNEPDDDLFGAQKPQKKVDIQPAPSKDIKTTTDIFEDDIFAAESIRPVKKPKEKKVAAEASLFDDNSDIFADLTHKPKEKKSKKKVEAKSIFDDDMDDIFSTSVSSTKKSKPKAKSTASTSETKPDAKASSMFDDPLNVLGK